MQADLVVIAIIGLVLAIIAMATDGYTSLVSVIAAATSFILLVVLVLMTKYGAMQHVQQLIDKRCVALVHDTTVVVDSVFVTNNDENAAASDGTETATEKPKAEKNASRDKGSTEKRQAPVRSGRLVIFFIHADWCGWCRKMEATTWRDASLKKQMDEDSAAFVDVNTSNNTTKWVDGSTVDVERARQASGYDGSSIPATVIERGSYRRVVVGYASASEIKRIIDELK